MAGYSLGDADLRIRKTFAKKNVALIPEIRNEFVYGKKTLRDKNGQIIGISEESSEFCIGAINNGFEEDFALEIFKDMEAFGKYCFNKSHSAAYGFLAYRTAWLSYYYPVEWNTACLIMDLQDGKNDAVLATLNSCKRRGIKLLPPDINKSKDDYSIEIMENGEKAIRFPINSIKGVGKSCSYYILKMLESDGVFTSFEDFISRVFNKNETLRKLVADVKRADKFSNPFNRTHIFQMIKAGVFEELEGNRATLYNYYLDIVGESKTSENNNKKMDEENYDLKTKLALELETIGYYISQHPLDNTDVYPYTDLLSMTSDGMVETSGILMSSSKKTIQKKGKNFGKTFYRLTLESRDGSTFNIMIFDNVIQKNPECITGLNSKEAKEKKVIYKVRGKYSIQYGSITAEQIVKVRSKNENTKANKKTKDTSSKTKKTLEKKAEQIILRDSLLDDELLVKVD